MNRKALVSIIVPVYNAAKTLHLCLDSLSAQTYRDLQIIFINDASTDNSLQVLEDYKASSDLQIEVISHEVNKGVATARNTGLNAVRGEYIYFIDADDAIENETIELSINKALEEDLEIVGFSWFLTFEKNERKMVQPAFNSSFEAIEKMMKGTMRWNLWLFLFKASLFQDHQIRFFDGKNMGEDLMVAIKLFNSAKKVAYLDKLFYHYGQSNTSSLTKTYSDNHIEQVTANVLEVENYLKSSQLSDKLGNLIYYLKLNIKLPLLISENTAQYKKWLNWFPESNPYVMDNVDLSIRTRLLQLAAVKKQFWLVKLYNKVVIRLIYGVLYK
ncbi:glycosyl transferase family A [Sphingobacterium cellulitidis]|uniref:glycosyltransferase family 2 protein n=1 Tax=Sphingobacterium cellulitidis TaxID=1768011 RepID=UPI000B945678|nr:glycosyltransferase family 2 protein [Sphingobacterium cellulitidis]OYD44682.1 glycosyl transferase family A [Sphingobacterium cellulitidis]